MFCFCHWHKNVYLVLCRFHRAYYHGFAIYSTLFNHFEIVYCFWFRYSSQEVVLCTFQCVGGCAYVWCTFVYSFFSYFATNMLHHIVVTMVMVVGFSSRSISFEFHFTLITDLKCICSGKSLRKIGLFNNSKKKKWREKNEQKEKCKRMCISLTIAVETMNKWNWIWMPIKL